MRTFEQQLVLAKLVLSDRLSTHKINEHVEHCQICQSQQFCDILENIITSLETQSKEAAKAKLEAKLRAAGLK